MPDCAVTYGMENVSIQSGGKPVIWKFLAVTMEAGDEVLYPSPGYPIYESMIRYLGGVPVPYSYTYVFCSAYPYLNPLSRQESVDISANVFSAFSSYSGPFETNANIFAFLMQWDAKWFRVGYDEA